MSTENFKDSLACKTLKKLFGNDFLDDDDDFECFARIVSTFCKIKLPEERTKINLIKWFDDNYEQVFPWIIDYYFT